MDCRDVDALVMEIVQGTNTGIYDLNHDRLVTVADLSSWLTEAGAVNLASGNPYLPGDANLDGFVDGSDFTIWNSNKFTSANGWCQADFNADGFVDGSDFTIWNAHKFTSSATLVAVPEPGGCGIIMLCFVVLWVCRHRTERSSPIVTECRWHGWTPLMILPLHRRRSVAAPNKNCVLPVSVHESFRGSCYLSRVTRSGARRWHIEKWSASRGIWHASSCRCIAWRRNG